jgi:hypothetical protein
LKKPAQAGFFVDVQAVAKLTTSLLTAPSHE